MSRFIPPVRTWPLLGIVSLVASACGGEAAYKNARPTAQPEIASARVPYRAGGPAIDPAAAVSPAPTGTSSAPNPERPPIDAPPAAVVAPIGALENHVALRHYFEALSKLEGGHGHDDVRIVQFGDSHTAADYETGVMRRALQARFGDGGRGFVAIGRPYGKYVQDGVRSNSTREWSSERGKLIKGKFQGDGCYGLAGCSVVTSKRGARAWATLSARASRIEVAYLEQPRGGSIDVFIDGAAAGKISTRGRGVVSAYHAFDVPDAPHHIELRAAGDGDVRVFGASLDRTQVGLTLDALGINGARVTTPLQWNEAHMAEQLKHRAPDLVVLAYGTNEAGDDTSSAVYERQVVDLLGRIARAVPSSSCLLLGPPDRAVRASGVWQTSTKLLDIIASQRRVARAAGCAFYSQLDAMGGEGSIASWASEERPRAMLDRVHLSRDGYAQLAGIYVTDMLGAYAAWRADTGLPPSKDNGIPVTPAAPLPNAPATPRDPIARK